MNTIIIDTKSDERFYKLLQEGKEPFNISKSNNLEFLKKHFEEQGYKVVEE